MNLLACLPNDTVGIAIDSRIELFPSRPFAQRQGKRDKERAIPLSVLETETDATVNQIKCGSLRENNVLVAVKDDGWVFVWFIDQNYRRLAYKYEKKRYCVRKGMKSQRGV